MATVQQRKGAYTITVYLGNDSNGKKIRQTTTFRPTKTTPKAIEKELNDFVRNFEKQVKEGTILSGDKIRFDDYARGEWVDTYGKDELTQSVFEGYVSILESYIFPEIGHLKLTDIKVIHLQKMVNKWNTEGKAPKTVRRRITALRSVLRLAYMQELIQEDPCGRLKLPKLKADDELHYFTVEQAETFLRAVETPFKVTFKAHTRTLKKTGGKYVVPEYTETYENHPQFIPYFYLAVYGGFRRGELVALTWKDIDFEHHTVSINKAIAKTKGSQILKAPKTEAGKREIVLPSVVFEKLKDWRYKEVEMSFSPSWEGYKGRHFDENPIFIQVENGHRMDVDTPSHKFDSIVKYYNLSCEKEEAKLPEIRLHDLRHTSATLLLANGVDIETVSHRLGHSKASITLDVYGHAMKDKDQTASDTLEALFA